MIKMTHCKHRWMIIEDYWDMGKRIVKYKCVDCPKDYTRVIERGDVRSQKIITKN